MINRTKAPRSWLSITVTVWSPSTQAIFLQVIYTNRSRKRNSGETRWLALLSHGKFNAMSVALYNAKHIFVTGWLFTLSTNSLSCWQRLFKRTLSVSDGQNYKRNQAGGWNSCMESKSAVTSTVALQNLMGKFHSFQ